jgi:hypothetical protein
MMPDSRVAATADASTLAAAASIAPKVHAIRHMAPRCSAIAGWMRARRDLAWTRRELVHVVELVKLSGGMVPRTEKDHHPDAFASLWFVRAAHDFAAIAMTGAQREKHPAHVTFYEETLLPLCTNIVQQFISDAGIDGIRMDDSAILIPSANGGTADHDPALRINTLWYNGLESTAGALMNIAPRDPAGAHFERLAGRFRRSFPKIYWCPTHKRICTPGRREAAEHGAFSDPDQLLLTTLACSPLPRTKQRLILAHFKTHALGRQGVLMSHPVHGAVESPLHLAWLAMGTAVDGEAEEVQPFINPLAQFREDAQRRGVYAYYQNERPVPGLTRPDPLATAEVSGALQQLLHRHG